MAKKLAGGAPVVVLDVKYGSGAFMRERGDARRLAEAMVAIGEGAGRRVRAVLSPMEQPLGRTVGHALEVREAIETLRGDGPPDLWDLTLELGAHLLVLSGEAAGAAEARARLQRLRDSGAAADRLRELVEAQGGDPRVLDDPSLLPAAPLVRTVAAGADGWLARLDARTVGEAALELGAGRRRKTDALDLSVGIRLLARVGDRVAAGEPVAELHAADAESAARAEPRLREALEVSPEPVPAPTTEYEVV
jgi:pyrimidine-nucleoside phosphorylase